MAESATIAFNVTGTAGYRHRADHRHRRGRSDCRHHHHGQHRCQHGRRWRVPDRPGIDPARHDHPDQQPLFRAEPADRLRLGRRRVCPGFGPERFAKIGNIWLVADDPGEWRADGRRQLLHRRGLADWLPLDRTVGCGIRSCERSVLRSVVAFGKLPAHSTASPPVRREEDGGLSQDDTTCCVSGRAIVARPYFL